MYEVFFTLESAQRKVEELQDHGIPFDFSRDTYYDIDDSIDCFVISWSED